MMVTRYAGTVMCEVRYTKWFYGDDVEPNAETNSVGKKSSKYKGKYRNKYRSKYRSDFLALS